MKRKQLHQSYHPFNPQPFEAFWSSSWHPVEQLAISDGAVITHIVDDGDVIEADIPMSHLRIRSREATWSDCASFLRQGIDICVLSNTHTSGNENDEINSKLVWLDARIRSIERKTHGEICTCQFYVSFYITQGPDMFMGNKKISKETSMVSIDQIAIVQNFELKPNETQYYRWSSTEDCFSVYQFKFFYGKFSSDLTWLLVASVLKKTAFEVKSMHNRIVYEITENTPLTSEENPNTHSYAVSFKMDNGVSTPFVVQFIPDNLPESSDGQQFSPYNLTELRRSKRHHVQPERYLACDNLPDYEIEMTWLGNSKSHKKPEDEIELEPDNPDEYDEMPVVPLSVQADNECQKNDGPGNRPRLYERVTKELGDRQLSQFVSDFKIPKDEPEEDINEIFSNYLENGSASLLKKKPNFDFTGLGMGNGSQGKGPRRKHARKSDILTGRKKECFYVRESIYDVKSFRKGSASAQICRELIRRCMINIDDALNNKPNQPPVVDQWKDFQTTKNADEPEKDEKTETSNDEVEISEVDMLWREMDLALASWYLLEDNEDHIKTTSNAQKFSQNEENICKHDYILDEQVGTICQLCGFVETEIKDMLPQFVSSTQWTSTKDQSTEDDSDINKTSDDTGIIDEFRIPNPSIAPSIEVDEKCVWALIPDLGNKLRAHQKKAFEFLWRNIAGSLVPSRMEENQNKRGGCVISHTPGAGKTLLIIAFLVSYLKLFPGSRPLVLAPKTTLYTWYKEIIKWKISIPVYQIHGGQTFKGEVLKQWVKLAPGLPKNQDVLHVLHTLEIMQNWLSHPSILLMGYSSFLSMTREDSSFAHRKYMAQLLKQCPGILILDEGHNPRSTKSRLRKGLMKVDTRLRVLLSGTLFQNNFGEYFNTLCLARPSFVNEVLKELDPRYEKRNKERRTQFSLENRGRKLLIDKISKKIDSNEDGERAKALKTLKKLTGKFIDVYEGGNSDELPGLQCYTLMMKLTSLQQDVLQKLQNRRPPSKGFPLELELLITLGAIHPYLIKTTECSAQYLNKDELDELEESKSDVKLGSKVRFVMNLVPRCIVRNEKVLIFCHNIAPINLLVQTFEQFYGWRKGREVLVLQGDIELFERGRIIDMFEEPGGLSRVMLASITACAEGISLTAASRVILLDSEWNPSKSKQAIARAFRPGQNKVVYVYQLLATGTLEEAKQGRTTWKEWVSDMIFSEEGVEDPSSWQAPKIEDELLREIVEEDRAGLFHRIMKNEKASNVIRGKGMMKSVIGV
ncbi:SNF2 domain-containing protein [Castilleja foliolosa]|uniref:SNF2 domain-containing protein n=1 Tax=Castilleja foliolosa TaxID=1961234 RepID=A0ABD3E765_9LAMI